MARAETRIASGGVAAARIRVLQVPDCPLVERLESDLLDCLAETGLGDELVEVVVGDHPLPTLVVDGVDVATGAPVAGEPRCRMDLPTRDQIRTALEALRGSGGPGRRA